MNRVRGTGTRNRKRRGVLTFEWILLISLLVIGIIGGLSAVRNALLCELGQLADCIAALNCGADCSGVTCTGTGAFDDGDFDCWWCCHRDK